MTALEDWSAALRAWAIPESILAAAPESPYGFPSELFARRAEDAAAQTEVTPTTREALEALPLGGDVLDVGVGGGATSIPLAVRAGRIAGVDESPLLLASFRDAAATAGVESVGVLGTWPEVAGRVPIADIVVCGHVLYNVRDPELFVRELEAHASRRVVLELTDRHPLAWMHDLWETFHGLPRPEGPTVADCEAWLRELGIDASREARPQRGVGWFDRREDAVALVRRRLCLAAGRDGEIERALGDRLVEHDGRWSAGPPSGEVVTLWWDLPAAAG
ncbi:MAG: methyltransferase domain-containing protein [Actinomycetota bacterium]